MPVEMITTAYLSRISRLSANITPHVLTSLVQQKKKLKDKSHVWANINTTFLFKKYKQNKYKIHPWTEMALHLCLMISANNTNTSTQ